MTRANLLDASRLAEEAALDHYSYVRSAYLQRRRSLIYDGNPPREPDPDRSFESRSGRRAGSARRGANCRRRGWSPSAASR